MKKIIFTLLTFFSVSTTILFAANTLGVTNSLPDICVDMKQDASFIRKVQTYICTSNGYKKFAVRELWKDGYGNLFVLYRGNYSNITVPVSYAPNNPNFKYTFYMSGGWEYFN